MTVQIQTVLTEPANSGLGDTVKVAFDKYNSSMSNVKSAVDVLQSTYANTSYGKFFNISVTNRVVGNLYLSGSDNIFINGSPVTTAAIVFPGGSVPNDTVFASVTSALDSAGNAAVTVAGGLGVAKGAIIGGNTLITSTTDAGDLNHAALITQGGLSVTKNARFGSTIYVTSGVQAGAGITAAGDSSFTSGTPSTNSASGALVVTGGVGVSGNINAGQGLNTGSDVYIGGNLIVNGTASWGTQTFSVVDNIIELHKPSNGSALNNDDGSDIGIKFNYYIAGIGANVAALVWAHDTQALEYYASGAEVSAGSGTDFSGGLYGTYKGGGFWGVNTTPSTSTTTGALRIAGGAGIAGDIYSGGNVYASYLQGTAITSAQPNITSLGTLIGLAVNGTTNLVGNVAATYLVPTNFSTANARITGGYATGLANVYATTAQFNNFSSGNAQITGGSLTGIAIEGVTTLAATNLSTGNAVITGGYISALTNAAITTGAVTTLQATNFSTGNAQITGGSITGVTLPSIATLQVANFSSPNAVIAGGYVAGLANASATYGTFTNLYAGNITGTFNGTIGSVSISTANIALYENLATSSTNATNYIAFYDKTTGNAATYTNTSVNVNPSTGNISAGGFVGVHYGSGLGLSNIPNSALANNSITVNGSSISLGGSATVTAAAGTLTGGTLNSGVTASSLTSVGTLTGLTVSGAIVPNSNVSIDIGSSSSWFRTFYGKSTQAQYADLAEKYTADAEYTPGTVLVFGGSAEVTTTTLFADVGVAGVVSTDPAYLMNSAIDGCAVALRGRVPVLVQGRVKKGDLLVTSTIAGVAVSVGRDQSYGLSVFAKSLTDKDSIDVGVIEAVVI